MFSTVYRVTQKGFYARPYTSMWAPVVNRQISKRYSSSCHVFINKWQELKYGLDICRFTTGAYIEVYGRA
jgi:hypothetical protein